MSSSLLLAAAVEAVPTASSSGADLTTIATPTMWLITIAAVIALIAFDFAFTHKPHEPTMKEATWWTVFYIALPCIFGAWLWFEYGSEEGVLFYSGYIVEKALSVDNLFVFIVILAGFAVPRPLRQRVLLWGVAGALVLRGIFIAVGAGLIARFSWVFFIFGLILLLTAIKVVRDAVRGVEEEPDPGQLPVVRLVRRLWPVSDGYVGTHMVVKQAGRRVITPLAVVVAAIMGTDVLFAVDSVPAVFGITHDPYLVFTTNAFALLGLRALYFVLEGSLRTLRYLPYGLGVILIFIAVKLVLHGAHLYAESVPDIEPVPSLIVIAGILAITIAASVWKTKQEERAYAAARAAERAAEAGVEPAADSGVEKE
jgi:tellurite resistance protein TerC